jgi:ribosome biogenesis GTPase
MQIPNLDGLGWVAFFEQQFELIRQDGWLPARVVREDRERYTVWNDGCEFAAEVSGKFHHEACRRADFPAVGDWVGVTARPCESAATIHGVLPRLTCFSRKAPGSNVEQQILAANVDTAFLVCGLDKDFNLRRIERYLQAAGDSGAAPVIVLNKADCCVDCAERCGAVRRIAGGAPTYAVSAVTGQGVNELGDYLGRGQTVVLAGSSGVGKSTLINHFLGAPVQPTGAVREDDNHGRHTTTRRELFVLPGGGIVIDVPGLRELQVWGDEETLACTFEDIEALAAQCRFKDCTHAAEPACAIRAALESGRLESGHFENYQKLQRELRHLAIENDARAKRAQKQKWKSLHRQMRKMNRERARWTL